MTSKAKLNDKILADFRINLNGGRSAQVGLDLYHLSYENRLWKYSSIKTKTTLKVAELAAPALSRERYTLTNY